MTIILLLFPSFRWKNPNLVCPWNIQAEGRHGGIEVEMENPQLSLPVEQPGRRQTLGVGNRKSWEFRGIYFRVLLSATKPPTFDLLHIDVHGSEIGMGFKLHTRHVPLPLPFCKEL